MYAGRRTGAAAFLSAKGHMVGVHAVGFLPPNSVCCIFYVHLNCRSNIMLTEQESHVDRVGTPKCKATESKERVSSDKCLTEIPAVAS